MCYFWRSGLCKWAAGEGGSLSFRVWFIFFCSLIGFWILFSKEAVTPASNSLSFQVLCILISPPVLCRKSSQARHCSHLCLPRPRKLWWAERAAPASAAERGYGLSVHMGVKLHLKRMLSVQALWQSRGLSAPATTSGTFKPLFGIHAPTCAYQSTPWGMTQNYPHASFQACTTMFKNYLCSNYTSLLFN